MFITQATIREVATLTVNKIWSNEESELNNAIDLLRVFFCIDEIKINDLIQEIRKYPKPERGIVHLETRFYLDKFNNNIQIISIVEALNKMNILNKELKSKYGLWIADSNNVFNFYKNFDNYILNSCDGVLGRGEIYVFDKEKNEFIPHKNNYMIDIELYDENDIIEDPHKIEKKYNKVKDKIDIILGILINYNEKELLRKILNDANLTEQIKNKIQRTWEDREEDNWDVDEENKGFSIEKYIEYEEYSISIILDINKDEIEIEIKFMLSDNEEYFNGHWYEIYYDENLNYQYYSYDG